MEYSKILDSLPKKPENSLHGYWANGDIILCESEEKANWLADFLEDLGVSDTVTTGYYDPVQDKETGILDSCTGWYYVDC